MAEPRRNVLTHWNIGVLERIEHENNRDLARQLLAECAKRGIDPRSITAIYIPERRSTFRRFLDNLGLTRTHYQPPIHPFRELKP